jgi:hypothetical protein
MSIDDIGRLTPADESLDHQIADTFATVQEADLNWTQKIWAALARKDGSMSVSFGLGKYHNRNVMDGHAGISRGFEQWTVRASRKLDPALQETSVGPVRYEVVDPLKKVRFCLDRNATQPIAFDILFEGALPPFFEKRNRRRSGLRTAMDVVRYHQTGKLSGWVEIDGKRQDVGDDWFGCRDHSWGMRGTGVGARIPDVQPNQGLGDMRLLWGPWLLTRPDGSHYELMHFWVSGQNWQYFSAHQNEADRDFGNARQTELRALSPNIRLDPKTRRFLGGEFELMLPSGEKRTVEVTPLGDAGFYLRTGEYEGWKGHWHGAWRGDYHEDGEHIADVRAALAELGQFRDAPVMIRDGDAIGFGIQESIYRGVFPELGLAEDTSHL